MARELVACLIIVVAGCARTNTVECSDRTCPAETICDEIHHQCVFPGQRTACKDKVDGDVCTAVGRNAICDQGYCIPGCGDGIADAGEECDDGNFASHDGCSSACFSEFAGWKQWFPAWVARSGQAAAYDVVHQRLVMFGGSTALDFLGDQWTRDATRTWTQSTAVMPGGPYAAMAYDPVQKRIVRFGGRNTTVVGDTWEYDGTTWTKQTPPTTPPTARYGASMVFDGSRNKIVLFGGRTETMQFNDTWEYDVLTHTWTQLATTGAPTPVRAWAAMAYDAARTRIVLFGGYLNGSLGDTWELVGSTWTLITPSTNPAPRWGASMAYLPSRSRVVLFGGVSNGVGADGDTWEYNRTWTAVTGPARPDARSDATLTYDPDHSSLVLVGGIDIEAKRIDDVWEYKDVNGAGAWSDQSSHFSPSLRVTPLTYDAAHAEVVAFGGCTPGGFPLAETWTFGGRVDTLAWKKRSPAAEPSTLCGTTTTYDSTQQRVVLFGGRGEVTTPGMYGTPNPATWQWDGTTWTKVSEAPQTAAPSTPRFEAAFADDAKDHVSLLFGGTDMFGSATAPSADACWEHSTAWTPCTSSGPAAASGAGMAYDPIHERVVLFTPGAETWVYSDHVWARLDLDRSPPARLGARVVYDPSRQRIVLFGGSSTTGIDYADLWELDDEGILPDGTWDPVRLLGAQPPTRAGPGLAPLPSLRALVMFGGNTFDDTWLLRYVSDTPDEKCDDGVDNDDDRRIDVADPDCQ